MIILDTNVVSALMRPELNAAVTTWLNALPQSQLWITSVSVMEVRSGLLFMPEGRRRTLFSQSFDQLLSTLLDGRTLAFDLSAAEQAASVDWIQHRKGRNIGVADLQIAGIALARRATLATRNIKDFANLGIPLVDPWTA